MESRKYLGRYFLEWANCWYEDGLLNDCSRVEELKNFIPLLARPGFANIELGLLEHLAEHVSAKGVDVVRRRARRLEATRFAQRIFKVKRVRHRD